jgi:hypothetical protein
MTISTRLRQIWASCGLALTVVGVACHGNDQSQGQSLCSAYCEKLVSCSVEAGQLSSDAGTSIGQAVGFCENITCSRPDQSDVLATLSACASQDCSAIASCGTPPPCATGGMAGAAGSTGPGGAPGEAGTFGSGGSLGAGGVSGLGGPIGAGGGS